MSPAPGRGEVMPLPSIPWQLEQFAANSCDPSCTLGVEGSVVGRTIPEFGWALAVATIDNPPKSTHNTTINLLPVMTAGTS
jgi:hypothetical protein